MKNTHPIVDMFCVVCDKPFTAHHGKALYCSRTCSSKGVNNQAKVKRSLGLLHEIEMSIMMKRQDFLLQAVCELLGISIPQNLIPKENKVSLKLLGYEMAKRINVYEKQNEKLLKTSKKKVAKKKIEPKLKKVNIATKMQEEIKLEEKVSEIDYGKLKSELKTLFTKTIQANTGKFPIFPPQINGRIDKIIDTIIPKIEGNVNNQIIIEYVEERITDITTMIDERYFNSAE